MFSVPSQPGENRGERLGEFESRSVKTRDAVNQRPSFLGFQTNVFKKCCSEKETILTHDKAEDIARASEMAKKIDKKSNSDKTVHVVYQAEK